VGNQSSSFHGLPCFGNGSKSQTLSKMPRRVYSPSVVAARQRNAESVEYREWSIAGIPLLLNVALLSIDSAWPAVWLFNCQVKCMNVPFTVTTQPASITILLNLSGMMRRMGDWWCTLMHNSVMWPIHGQYQCRRCGRSRPVPWAQPDAPSRSLRPTRSVVVLRHPFVL
jgi:hypothetical protein